jgi:hypothetical protein
VDSCNRNNTAIYAVDPRGLAVGGFDITSNISMRTSQNYLNSSIDSCANWPTTPTAAPSSTATISPGHEANHATPAPTPGRL